MSKKNQKQNRKSQAALLSFFGELAAGIAAMDRAESDRLTQVEASIDYLTRGATVASAEVAPLIQADLTDLVMERDFLAKRIKERS
jgi:hypothetical protein